MQRNKTLIFSLIFAPPIAFNAGSVREDHTGRMLVFAAPVEFLLREGPRLKVEPEQFRRRFAAIFEVVGFIRSNPFLLAKAQRQPLMPMQSTYACERGFFRVARSGRE